MSRYGVEWGYGLAFSQGFPDFAPALACYIDHLGDKHQPRILGEFAEEGEDYYSDGLTLAEQAAVEEAEAMFDRIRRADRQEDHDPAHDPGCSRRE